MEKDELELIDYLDVIWKRKGLIVGGTLLTALTALVVSLSMPKIYEVSRTLKIGQLPISEKVYVIGHSSIVSTKIVKDLENREAVIGRLRDHRVLKIAMEKIHLGLTTREIEGLVSIDTKTNPGVHYTVQAYDAQQATRVADWLAEYIIKIHRPIFEGAMQIIKDYEAQLETKIRSLEIENRRMKTMIENQDINPTAGFLLQAKMGERERLLIDLRSELKQGRLARLGAHNTTVIAADAPPNHAVKPRIKLSVMLAGGFGLLMFTFVAFFMEYIEKARSER